MPAHKVTPSQAGSTWFMIHRNEFSPLAAAWSASGMASTTAHNITQPNTADTHTARTMQRGTACAAPMVSSAVCAEASNPVMVYAGSSKPRANSPATLSVRGHTPAPADPL